MSHQLINLSDDLKRLRNEGYHLEIRGGHLLVKDVPYVNSKKEVQRGTLVCKLTLAGDVTARPGDHIAHFIGEHPCDQNGMELEKIKNASNKNALHKDVVIDHTFSAKPQPSGVYDNYYDKVTTYVGILSRYAQALSPDTEITAKTFPAIEADEDEDSPFNYIDTASSRAEIEVVTDKLRSKKIAILGTGGTGAYTLDFTAKTPVDEIHLYDGDDFLQHNAFRVPGAPSIEELSAKPKKTAYLKGLYSKMHRGIVAHEEYVDASNVEQLRVMDFVFVCLDRGTAKKLIIEKLEEYGIPFVDVGMGIYEADGSLGGILRVTTSTPDQRDHVRGRIPFSDGVGRNEYATNIQIAELNALNAALAIIKWKKLCGFYLDFDHEYHSTFTITGNLLLNEDKNP
ncbi:MAG: ThiF family adenylyltransferase [Acidobacteria bacterium]|nr:ThiF family adenylyltransferase [Acidobacteriota bacterium]